MKRKIRVNSCVSWAKLLLSRAFSQELCDVEDYEIGVRPNLGLWPVRKGGDVLRCFLIVVLGSFCSGFQIRSAHRLKVYVPGGSLLGRALSQEFGNVEVYKIGVMKNNRFNRALDLVALVTVRGYDVQDFTGNSVLIR
jgi:hypothetical protein